MVGLGVRVEIGAEDGHCGFVFLELFDELGFCMNLLECLVRRASDIYWTVRLTCGFTKENPCVG